MFGKVLMNKLLERTCGNVCSYRNNCVTYLMVYSTEEYPHGFKVDIIHNKRDFDTIGGTVSSITSSPRSRTRLSRNTTFFDADIKSLLQCITTSVRPSSELLAPKDALISSAVQEFSLSGLQFSDVFSAAFAADTKRGHEGSWTGGPILTRILCISFCVFCSSPLIE